MHTNLTNIFPEEDFRLKMRFHRDSPEEFFAQSDKAEPVRSERRRWHEATPQTCLAMDPEAAPLLHEVVKLADQWEVLPEKSDLASSLQLDPLALCRWLSEQWETDFLLLRPDSNGVFRLRGGALCFPSHWDLHSKMGCTISDIHHPVPGLNEALGKSIDGFLARIRPGISWERHNWGLSRSPELNQHPSRDLPGLDESVELDEVWWRLEDQSLVALPESGGILFGIRVTVHPLREVREHPAARRGLQQALKTMPDEMATYKGIRNARMRIIELLES